MRPVMIVQGAWGASAAWSPVADLLRAKGLAVYHPALTGLGERRHHFSGDVTLSTHIADVAAVIEAEDLRDLVLVGHSYGGMIVTALAHRFPERLSALVYLDAFVPGDGDSLLDLLGPEAALRVLAEAGMQGGLAVPPPERHAARVPEAMRRHMTTRSAQPLGTMVEKLRLDGPAPDLPRHYVAAAIDQGPVFARTHATLRDDPAWTAESLATGHMLHLEQPEAVAAIILRFAGPDASP